MKKTFTLLTSFLLTVTIGNTQNYEWAKSFGASSSDRGNCITLDASGNVYTTGYFEGTIDFNPGAGTANLTAVGSFDVFVQKMDPVGNFLWAKSFGGTSGDNANGISVDASGNVYTTGRFIGTVDFNPGPGISNLTSIAYNDAFVQKLDAAGNFLWAKSFGGAPGEGALAFSIKADAAGNVYTTGFFTGGTADFDPGTGIANLTSAGGFEAFVQKMDASGNFLWAKRLGGTLNDVAYMINVDNSGNVYTIGFFKGTADLDPGPSIANFTSAGNEDIFIQKMDASGNFIWAKTFGGTTRDNGFSVGFDASGNVYTTGLFSGTVDFDPGAGVDTITMVGGNDVFVQKLDPSGNFLWVKSFGGVSFDQASGMSVDAAGNVYITGVFVYTVDFDPGAGTANLTSHGVGDIFVEKMDASGNFLWANCFGASDEDFGASISADASGNVYATGSFRATPDFDPGAGVAFLTSAGIDDIYILKMSQGATGIDASVNNVQMSAYPNPTTGMVNVRVGNALNDVELVLTDLYGRVIAQQSYATVSNTSIELTGAAGMYFLIIKTPSGKSTMKLVKE